MRFPRAAPASATTPVSIHPIPNASNHSLAFARTIARLYHPRNPRDKRIFAGWYTLVMAVEKKAVTEILAQMATYLELKGENPFKIRAYENAARIIEGIQGDIQNLIVTGDIRKIKGIGQGIADKLREFAETGYIQEHKKLQKALPPGLLNILKIQGLGPKRAKILHDKLGIQSIADLEKACKKNVLMK